MDMLKLDSYRKGVQIADEIQCVERIIGRLNKGAGIWLGDFDEDGYGLPEMIKKAIRADIVRELESYVGALRDDFEKL